MTPSLLRAVMLPQNLEATTTSESSPTSTGTGSTASATESVNSVGGKRDDGGMWVAGIGLAVAINMLL